MTTSIVRLPIRSSPTYCNIVKKAVQLAYARSVPLSTLAYLDPMLAKAKRDYDANPPQQRNQLAKQLFSSSPSVPNADIREQFKQPVMAAAGVASASARIPQPFSSPLNNRSTNLNNNLSTRQMQGPGRSLVTLYGNSDSFKQPSFIDLTGSDSLAKAKEAVYFAEDDFSDDDNLDLDYEAPSALPALPSHTLKKAIPKENMPPPPSSAQTEVKIPWSSSPASHFQIPRPPRTLSGTSASTEKSLKRESSGDLDSLLPQVPAKVKRRKLPPSFRQEEPEEEDEDDYASVAKTPANRRKNLWDASASAVKEQRKQFKNQRQVQEPAPQPEELTMEEIQEITTSNSKNYAISLSEEQRHVLDLVVNKNQSVFFTGPAGTGKSVLMRAIIADLKKKHAKDPERVAVTASTGLAACNIGGITLHSFSGIGLGKEEAPELIKKIRRNPKAKNRWLRTKCLVIDEISMVDGELFDKLSQIGRTIRNNGRPWGGIQLIITGDFFQLPPVPDAGAKRESKFAFDAGTWTTSIDHTIGLTQVFRQRDPKFANMLNEIRLGKISEETVRAFKALSRPLSFNDGLGMAELFSTRAEVEGSNEKRLRDLPGKSHRYESMDSGDKAVRDKLLANMMAPKSIDLKLNAQVMLIKNLDDSLVNGSLGKVIAFSDEKTFDITGDGYGSDIDEKTAKAKRKLAMFSNNESGGSTMKYPVVQFRATDGSARTILCVPEDWKVELPNGDVQAKRTQLPLILAWALSIHKAQGQTLERVKVNLGRVFEKGQAYVALSRATCQEGLEVYGFDKWKVMAHPRVINFYNKLYSAEDALKRRPATVSDFITNRKGPVRAPTLPPPPVLPPKKAREVIDLDDDEEAMASYGF